MGPITKGVSVARLSLFEAVLKSFDVIADAFYSTKVTVTVGTKEYTRKLYVSNMGIPYIVHKEVVYIICNDIEPDCTCDFCSRSVKATPKNFDLYTLPYKTQIYFQEKTYEKTSAALCYAVNN